MAPLERPKHANVTLLMILEEAAAVAVRCRNGYVLLAVKSSRSSSERSEDSCPKRAGIPAADDIAVFSDR